MGRSRSRSPRRDRRRRSRSRSRSRDKERTRDHDKRRHESHKSRSPRSSRRSPRHQRSRRRSRSRSQSNDEVIYTGTSHISECPPKPKKAKPVAEPQNGTETDVNPEESEMMKLMGFAGFDSTKGKKVEGKDISAVNVVQKRKYRQYMNRRGGFNRPLDFVA